MPGDTDTQPQAVAKAKISVRVGALPSLTPLRSALPHSRRRGIIQASAQKQAPAQKPVFPECFAEVSKRRSSQLPAHATLVAIASTLPATNSSPDVYLAALVISLSQFTKNSAPQSHHLQQEKDKADRATDAGNSRKARRRAAAAARARQRDVQEMSGIDAKGNVSRGKNEDAEMKEGGNEETVEAEREEEEEEENNRDVTLVQNLVYLIELAAQGASLAILNAKFSEILGALCDAVLYAGESAPLVARHAAAALATVISSLTPQNACSVDSQHAMLNVLRICTYSAPKCRRGARDAMLKIAKADCLPGIVKGASAALANAFAASLSDAVKHMETTANSATAKDEFLKCSTKVIHHLTAVNYFAFALTPLDAAKVAKQLVLLAQKKFREISFFVYNALTFLFSVPKELAAAKTVLPERVQDLSVDLFGDGLAVSTRLLHASGRIPEKDAVKLLAACLQLELPKGSSHDDRLSRCRCLATMSTNIMKFYRHTPPPKECTSAVVAALLQDFDPRTLSPHASQRFSVLLRDFLAQHWLRALPEVLQSLQEFCALRYKAHWSSVFPVLREYVAIDTNSGHSAMKSAIIPFINKIVQMRQLSNEASDSAALSVAEGLIAAVIKGGGAEHVLTEIPLKLEGDTELLVSNAWILPILRENLRNAPLALWSTKLAPLKHELQTAAKKAEDDGAVVEGKNLEMYARQILAVLPGLCTSPADLGQSQVLNIAFQAIHSCFVSEEPEVQNYALSALRALSDSILNHDDSEDFQSGMRASFSSRLKKLFPSIAELAEKMMPERRGSLLQSLTVAARATNDSGLVVSLLRKSIRRFLEVSVSNVPDEKDMTVEVIGKYTANTRVLHATADVSIALVESGIVPNDANELSLLKRALLPLLSHRADPALQKKAYRAIVSLLAAGAFSSASGMQEVIQELAGASADVVPGAQSSQLTALDALISLCCRTFNEEEKTVILKQCTSNFLPEAVLGLRDTSEKTRQAAGATLEAFGKAWASGKSPELGIDKFFVALAAGLGGRSTAMVAGSLSAMALFMKSFKSQVRSSNTLGMLCESMFAQSCPADPSEGDSIMADKEIDESLTHVRPGPVTILMRHEALEVQRAALGALKAAISTLGDPVSRIMELLPGFLPSLVAVAAESKKREIRLLVKVLIERLLKKCGREVMEECFPEEHKKLLSSVRKAHDKERAKKTERRALADMKRDPSPLDALSGNNVDNVLDEKKSSFKVDNDIDSDSSDSDLEEDFVDGNALLADQRRQLAGLRSSTPIQEKAGEVLDLLNDENIDATTNSQLLQNNTLSATRINMSQKSASSVKHTDEGKPIFVESEDESREAENGSDSSDVEDPDEGPSCNQPSLNQCRGKKRQRPGVGNESGRGKKMKGSFGEEYRSKRAAGDIKRPGRPDPYAFVPLGVSSNLSAAKIASSTVAKGRKAKRQKGFRFPRSL